MTGEQLTLPIERNTPERMTEGVSVSLEARARALGELAAVYAAYASADGMVRALNNPEYRKEMKRRYEDPDGVAAVALQKALWRLREAERTQAEVLTNAATLITTFDMAPADVEALKLQTTIEVRRAIGVDVGSERRREVLDTLYSPLE